MWRYLIVAALLAGCAQLPPSPQDIEAKKFESIPGKAAIYVVRDPMSVGLGAPIWLGQGAQVTLFQGNYLRWVVEPGSLTISGIGASTASITIQAQAGKIYFVHFRVEGNMRIGVSNSALSMMDDQGGRALVMQAVLVVPEAKVNIQM
jgi:hypothetical protein